MTVTGRSRQALQLIVVWLVLICILLVIVEGFASLTLVGYGLARGEPEVAERRHTIHDSLLGWANVPNSDIPDMYGKGVDLQINAQGFRASKPTTAARAAGTRRAICLGDSFTMGFGVANDKTWCHLLTTLNPNLETVNMGQGGYGLDQAYLWYLRDGRKLDHDLLIFAMITADLGRMRSSQFIGNPKPRLSIDNDTIVVRNVPVPRASRSRLSRRFGQAVTELRAAEFIKAALRRVGTDDNRRVRTSNSEMLDLSIKLFAELKTVTAGKNSEFVVVWLPTHGDFASLASDSLRARLDREMSTRGITFIDLVPAQRALPIERAEQMFIPQGLLDYAAAADHYTAAGNEWTARALHDRLMLDSASARALGAPTGSRRQNR